MLAAQRQQRILDMVLKSGAVTTADVAKALAISEETARKDFEKLEADRLLTREHGGAVCLDDYRRDLSLDSREVVNVAEKKAVAQLALGQIRAGDTVFFDASSTVFYLACLLPNVEIVVLTTALKVAIELARRPAVQVILAGGIIGHSSLSCQPDFANSFLERAHVQKAFLSCRGMDAVRGLSDADPSHAEMKRRIVAQANQTILLADHSKMGVKSSWFFAKLSDISLLISNRKPAPAIMRALNHGGGKAIFARAK
jgi:DeoR/GlpR family transcriptional regulator of sugar metabolism